MQKPYKYRKTTIHALLQIIPLTLETELSVRSNRHHLLLKTIFKNHFGNGIRIIPVQKYQFALI